MSRLRVSNRPGGWLDEGPSAVPEIRAREIGGELVKGYATVGYPTIAKTPAPEAERDAARRRWNSRVAA